MERSFVISVTVWFLDLIKAVFYSPVVLGFASIFFITLTYFHDLSSLKIIGNFLQLIGFHDNVTYTGNDIVSKFGFVTFIGSIVIGLISVITGKKFAPRRKFIFIVLASVSAIGWIVATVVMYSQGHDRNFFWLGPVFLCLHLIVISVSMLISYLVDIITKYLDSSNSLRDFNK